MFTVLRGRPTNDVVDGCDHVRALGEEGWYRSLGWKPHQLEVALGVERDAAGEHLEEHDAERVDIDTPVELAQAHDLRR